MTANDVRAALDDAFRLDPATLRSAAREFDRLSRVTERAWQRFKPREARDSETV